MKKILLLFIASSLSLFATIRGYDENEFIKAYKQHTNVPIQRTSHFYETDIYVEPNKKSSKGGKEIVFENTLNAIEAYDYKKAKLYFEKFYISEEMCKAQNFLFGDKLNNVIVTKFKHLGKTRFEFKLDASMCR